MNAAPAVVTVRLLGYFCIHDRFKTRCKECKGAQGADGAEAGSNAKWTTGASPHFSLTSIQSSQCILYLFSCT